MQTENVFEVEQANAERAVTLPPPRRHLLTMEHSPEETLKRMRALPERAARLKEIIRAQRTAHAR